MNKPEPVLELFLTMDAERPVFIGLTDQYVALFAEGQAGPLLNECIRELIELRAMMAGPDENIFH